jgi:O-antigen biosynthesis rhamnosyltransferase
MGGIEQVIHHIAEGSKKYSVISDVLFLASNPAPRKIEAYSYDIHRARLDAKIASTSFSMSVFLRFWQLAKKSDVIHYHYPWPFMDMVHFATMVKKPTLVTYHSDIVRQKKLLKLYRPLKLRFLSDVSHIVATSPNYLATSEALIRFKHKVSVIPIGINKGAYKVPSVEKLAYWRAKQGEKFFLFIGVLRYYKGLHILLEANKGIDYPIVIVGAGPIESEIKAQAAHMGLQNIHFLGHLPEEDKVALLMLCYCILFPSHLRSEAFGVSLLEGAMYGKPMISSEIGTGTTFINIADETGLVVPPSDPLALRQALGHLWEHPDLAAQMGRRAEERYYQHFTSESMVRSYVELYHELVKRHKLK